QDDVRLRARRAHAGVDDLERVARPQRLLERLAYRAEWRDDRDACHAVRHDWRRLRSAPSQHALDEPRDRRRRYGSPESVDHHAVDADEAPLGVHERSTRVARRQSDIGHDPPRRSGARVARDTVKDAHRERVVDAERVPVREYELADAKRVRVAYRQQWSA